MRAPTVLLVLATQAVFAPASVCPVPRAELGAAMTGENWTLDHYLYDPSLRKTWAVLLDCNHPQGPARMELAAGNSSPEFRPQVTIRAGSAIEIVNPSSARASIRLTGTAIETAAVGHPIRVRLSAGGNIVLCYARSAYTVELDSAAKPSWNKEQNEDWSEQ
jgi:hypothetical protein